MRTLLTWQAKIFLWLGTTYLKFLEVDHRWANKYPLKRLVYIVIFSEGQNSKLCLGLGLIDPISDQRHAPAFRYFFSCLLLSTPARQSGGGTSCFSTGTSWQRCRVDWSIRARYSRWKLYSSLRRFSPFAQKQQHFREKQKIRPNNDIFIRTHFSSKTADTQMPPNHLKFLITPNKAWLFKRFQSSCCGLTMAYFVSLIIVD